jgi:hypothetical protein
MNAKLLLGKRHYIAELTVYRASMFLLTREYEKVKHTDGWNEMSDRAITLVKKQASIWGITPVWKAHP